jgi:hypothetical protein
MISFHFAPTIYDATYRAVSKVNDNRITLSLLKSFIVYNNLKNGKKSFVKIKNQETGERISYSHKRIYEQGK